MIFDNSKSEDFDVYPFRFWNLSDRIRRNERSFKTLNVGAEFFSFLMEHFFEGECLKGLDIRTIIDKLKLLEHECHLMHEPSKDKNTLKYKFLPIETHQMMECHVRKSEEEFKQANITPLSDDDEPLMTSIKQINVEQQRFYNKYDLQMEIKSDPKASPLKNDAPSYSF